MKKKIFTAFLFLFLFLYGYPCPAQQILAGNDFLSLKEEQRLWYVVGFTDGWVCFLISKNKSAPTGFSYKQSHDIIYKYLIDNPSSRNGGLFALAFAALNESFPWQNLKDSDFK